MRANLSAAVLHAIAHAPCSVRTLAHAAGVSESLLYQLRDREFDATVDVAEKLAAALEGWAARCATEARKVRAAARRVPPRTKGRS